MPVISNSSPLIALTCEGSAVADLPDWILIRELSHPLQPSTVSGSIGPGGREVISLGLELGATLLILDEQPARRLATSLGFRLIGAVGLLMAGKERRLLAKIRPEFGSAAWQSGSFWIKISMIGSSPSLESDSEAPGDTLWRTARRL